jgi:hypothetical protein
VKFAGSTITFPPALFVFGLVAEPTEPRPTGKLIEAGDHHGLPVDRQSAEISRLGVLDRRVRDLEGNGI